MIVTYQGNGGAAEQFGKVEYASDVAAEGLGRYCIRFADHLTHRGRRFTLRWEQIIEVDDCGRIVRISHCDLPGQVEALSEFRELR